MPVSLGNKEIPNQVRNDGRVCAFTLAEVLITLVIVGVIAALTIPNLMQKYQEQTTVKKVQKFYSNLSNAYSLAMKDNGPANDWKLTSTDKSGAEKIYELLFKPYFKIGKNCGTNNTGNCIANGDYRHLNNNIHTKYSTNSHYYKITLEDGAAVWFKEYERPDITIFYDINGPKEPNQYGKDLFTFYIEGRKVYPPGIPSGDYSFTSNSFNSTCKTTATGYGCTAWVIYKGNMDYLHCDLTWDKRSCRD